MMIRIKRNHNSDQNNTERDYKNCDKEKDVKATRRRVDCIKMKYTTIQWSGVK